LLAGLGNSKLNQSGVIPDHDTGVPREQICIFHHFNKCIGDDTKATARQSLNCI